MLTPELEQLIQYALADGVLTDKERAVLMKKAEAAGADLDEFEMILEAKLHEAKKSCCFRCSQSIQQRRWNEENALIVALP